jgi:gliding motility-associated-like protein
MMRFFYLFIFTCLLFTANQSTAQVNYIIQHNSTCVGTPIIFNSTVFETAQFPTTIQWVFGDAASGLLDTAKGTQQPLHTYTTPGKYTVSLHVVDAGAGTINLTETVTIVFPVTHNFGPDVFLCGDTGTYVLNAPIIAGVQYEWNDDSLTKGPVLTVKESGAYTVKINGCAVTDTIGVFFTPKPNLDLGKDHVLCKGEQLTLNAASENATYQWWLNGAAVNNPQAQLAVKDPGGQYIVKIDAGGCGIYSDTANITFSNTNAPPFNLGPDTLLCPKEVFNLTATVTGATAYTWGSKGLDINDKVYYNIGAAPSISITNPGRYWAFVTVSNTCEVTDTMLVRYRGDKALNFNDTAICQGSTLILDADFGTGVYKWESIPPQRNDQNNTNQSTYYIYNPGFYAVTATVGQCVFKDSLNVVFNDSLKLSMPKDTTLCQGETYIITPKSNTTDFTWQDGTKVLTYSATQSGLYRLIAKNGCGTDTASIKLAFEACPCALLLPNAFTPNGDGNNDNFRPLHACDMKNYSMTIFNRYGEKIFFTKDPLQGWSGKNLGKQLTMGAYIWLISYTKLSTGQLIQKQGSVLLLR